MQDLLTASLLKTWVLDGGPVMFLLVPCSLLMVGAALQLLIRLRPGRVIPPELTRQAASASANETTRANFLRALRADERPLAHVVRVALQPHKDLTQPPDPRELDAQLEAAAIEAADEMGESLGLLQTLYTVAPLIGLLGTVLGLMTTFGVFATGNQRSLEEMSKGVKQHLVATVWGLCIAIAAYAMAYWLQRLIIVYERRKLPNAGLELVTQLFAEGHARPGEARAGHPMETAGGKPMLSTTMLINPDKLRAGLAAANASGGALSNTPAANGGAAAEGTPAAPLPAVALPAVTTPRGDAV